MGNIPPSFPDTTTNKKNARCNDCTGYEIVRSDGMYKKVHINDNKLFNLLRDDMKTTETEKNIGWNDRPIWRWDFSDVSRLYVVEKRWFFSSQTQTQWTA